MKPEIGKPAPSFSAPVVGEEYHGDATVSLKEFRGQRVVLVFYPKDDTPGCTKQACALSENWDSVKAKSKIFGVSIDSVKSHRKFIDKYKLSYPLISDEDRKIVEGYGVWVEKSMYGKKYMGTERSTFVIDAKGNLEAILEKVSPDAHLGLLEDVLG